MWTLAILLSVAGFILFFNMGHYLSRLRLSPSLRKSVWSRQEKSSPNFAYSQIFADLKTGIAVFDAKNKLSTFNPAFSAIFYFDTEWLLRQPDIGSVFTRMLEQSALPVPKDFNDWLKTVQNLRSVSSNQFWQDRWTLPDGRIIDVTARSSGKERIFLYFDDITDRQRRERDLLSELALLHSSLDASEKGLAIFDRGGALAFSNSQLDALLETDPDAPELVGFSEIISSWQNLFQPNPFWGDLRSFANTTEDRAAWEVPLTLNTGPKRMVRVSPLPHGALMCEFWSED
ncbi:MAG: PAS-domain containing protein [Pseudomonadota bacterium]